MLERYDPRNWPISIEGVIHTLIVLSGAILAVFSLVLMSALGAVRRIDTGYQVHSETPKNTEQIAAAPSNTA